MTEAIIQVIFQDRILETVKLDKDSVTIGRMPENDIVIPNLGVSRNHCRILRNENNQYHIEDLDSANGTLVNGVRVKHSPIYNNDEILIGKHKLIFQLTTKGVAGFFKSDDKKDANLWVGDRTFFTPTPPVQGTPKPIDKIETPLSPAPETAAPSNEESPLSTVKETAPQPEEKPFTMADLQLKLRGHYSGLKIIFEGKVIGVEGLAAKEVTIGRDATNDIVIDNLAVSRKHAHILYHDGQYVIEDLGSANGIRVNGVSVKRSPLYPGDEISTGKHILVFNTTKRLLSGVSEQDIRKAAQAQSPQWQTGTYFNADAARESDGAPASDEAPPEEKPAWDGKYAVRVEIDGRQAASYVLKKQVTCIGRLSENDIVIDNIGVSRLHARIIIEENSQCYVEDEDSSNGIVVNGLPVKRSPLYPGDEVKIVKHKLIFDLAHKAPPEKAAFGGKISKEHWRMDATFTVTNKEQELKIKEWAEKAARMKTERGKKIKKTSITQPDESAAQEADAPGAPQPDTAYSKQSEIPPTALDFSAPISTPETESQPEPIPQDEAASTPETSPFADKTPIFDPAAGATEPVDYNSETPPEEPSTSEISVPYETIEPKVEADKGDEETSEEAAPTDDYAEETTTPAGESTDTDIVTQYSAKLALSDGDELRIESPKFIIGKGDDANYIISGKGMKKHHAVIEKCGENKWKISARGLFTKITVNGNKVRSAPLENDDEIKICEFVCRFVTTS